MAHLNLRKNLEGKQTSNHYWLYLSHLSAEVKISRKPAWVEYTRSSHVHWFGPDSRKTSSRSRWPQNCQSSLPSAYMFPHQRMWRHEIQILCMCASLFSRTATLRALTMLSRCQDCHGNKQFVVRFSRWNTSNLAHSPSLPRPGTKLGNCREGGLSGFVSSAQPSPHPRSHSSQRGRATQLSLWLPVRGPRRSCPICPPQLWSWPDAQSCDRWQCRPHWYLCSAPSLRAAESRLMTGSAFFKCDWHDSVNVR